MKQLKIWAKDYEYKNGAEFIPVYKKTWLPVLGVVVPYKGYKTRNILIDSSRDDLKEESFYEEENIKFNTYSEKEVLHLIREAFEAIDISNDIKVTYFPDGTIESIEGLEKWFNKNKNNLRYRGKTL